WRLRARHELAAQRFHVRPRVVRTQPDFRASRDVLQYRRWAVPLAAVNVDDVLPCFAELRAEIFEHETFFGTGRPIENRDRALLDGLFEAFPYRVVAFGFN